jgi:5-methylcytosine-specific restriction endonuclease McrA
MLRRGRLERRKRLGPGKKALARSGRLQTRLSEDPELKKNKPLVRARDGRCRWCAGDVEHVHHIRYRSEVKDHSLENLISLCRRCHELVHSSKKTYQPLLMILVKMPSVTVGSVFFEMPLR